MDIYGYLWISMDIYGYSMCRYLWIFMDIYWISMDMCRYLWIFMDSYEYLWIFMDIYGYLWISMDMCRYLWIFMDICGYLCIFMDIYGDFTKMVGNPSIKNINPPEKSWSPLILHPPQISPLFPPPNRQHWDRDALATRERPRSRWSNTRNWWPWPAPTYALPQKRSEVVPGVRFWHGYPLVMTNSLLLKIAIEIVSFPIKNCDVSLLC